MKRLASLIAFLALPIVALVPSAQVFADSPGQLSNAATNYEIRNVTTNGKFGQTASATCGETVKYSVLLANSDFGLLKNLTVKADLTNGNISASATNAANAITSVSGKVTVSVTGGGTLAYIPGSTVRITSDGKTTTNLSDGITSGGVNAGELNGSTQTFVQFQAKVNCPTPPEDKEIQVCRLSDKKYPVTIKESEFDEKKYSKDPNDCKEEPKDEKMKVCRLKDKEIVWIKESEFDKSKYSKDFNDCAKEETPSEIPSTGPAGIIGSLVGASALGYGAYAYAASRKALRGPRN